MSTICSHVISPVKCWPWCRKCQLPNRLTNRYHSCRFYCWLHSEAGSNSVKLRSNRRACSFVTPSHKCTRYVARERHGWMSALCSPPFTPPTVFVPAASLRASALNYEERTRGSTVVMALTMEYDTKQQRRPPWPLVIVNCKVSAGCEFIDFHYCISAAVTGRIDEAVIWDLHSGKRCVLMNM